MTTGSRDDPWSESSLFTRACCRLPSDERMGSASHRTHGTHRRLEARVDARVAESEMNEESGLAAKSD